MDISNVVALVGSFTTIAAVVVLGSRMKDNIEKAAAQSEAAREAAEKNGAMLHRLQEMVEWYGQNGGDEMPPKPSREETLLGG